MTFGEREKRQGTISCFLVSKEMMYFRSLARACLPLSCTTKFSVWNKICRNVLGLNVCVGGDAFPVSATVFAWWGARCLATRLRYIKSEVLEKKDEKVVQESVQ